MKTRTIHIRVMDAEYARLSTLAEPFGSLSGYVRNCLELGELKNGRPSSKKEKSEAKQATAQAALLAAERKLGLR